MGRVEVTNKRWEAPVGSHPFPNPPPQVWRGGEGAWNLGWAQTMGEKPPDWNVALGRRPWWLSHLTRSSGRQQTPSHSFTPCSSISCHCPIHYTQPGAQQEYRTRSQPPGAQNQVDKFDKWTWRDKKKKKGFCTLLLSSPFSRKGKWCFCWFKMAFLPYILASLK